MGPDWEKFRVVTAPGFSLGTRSTPVTLHTSTDTVGRLGSKKQPNSPHWMGQFYGLVRGDHLGDVPPTDTPLTKAYALYAGVLRAKHILPRDTNVLVYITNPPKSFIFRDATDIASEGLEETPRRGVFVTYVQTLDSLGKEQRDAELAANRGRPLDPSIDGLVLYWAWLWPTSNDEQPLPHIDPNMKGGRYAHRIW
jgi:hypothetical protein